MVPCPPRRVPVALAVRSLSIALAWNLTAPAAALADDTRAGDAPLTLDAARDLFVDAESDEDAGRWAGALAKLQRVAEVKLTPGVRYHSALCEEHLGHLVTALSQYEAAAAQARAENAADVLRLVDARVADVSSRLALLTVVVAPPGDAEVTIDGEALAPGVAVRADPGPHRLEARAPGRASFATVLTLPERSSMAFELHLEPVKAERPSAPARVAEVAAPAPETEAAGARRAVVASIAAVVLATGGAAAYLQAGHEQAAAQDACAARVATSANACDATRTPVRAWDWIAVGAWAGAAALGAVAVVTLAAPRRATIALGPASLAIDGSF